jgi:hypothetical protein
MVEHRNARAFRRRRQTEEFLAIGLGLDFKNALSRGNSETLTEFLRQLPTSTFQLLNFYLTRWELGALGSWEFCGGVYGTTAIGACQKATLRPFGSSTLT